MQQVTLGGDRLGSGNKNKIALRNYERSTHNLSKKTTTSMQCGVLYPFSVIPAMRGDSFDINVNADARTIPTKGPLFGSFKMQIDYFQCPWRLYQALLHNNPLALGLKMNQVKLPVIELSGVNSGYDNAFKRYKINNSALLKYLGLSGLGMPSSAGGIMRRNINAIPVLAYYEIFKTYYANKQEENAYVISANSTERDESEANYLYVNGVEQANIDEYIQLPSISEALTITLDMSEEISAEDFLTYITFDISDTEKETSATYSLKELDNVYKQLFKQGFYKSFKHPNYTIILNGIDLKIALSSLTAGTGLIPAYMQISNTNIPIKFTENTLQLLPFNLQNIDDMRLEILSKHTLGEAFKIGTTGTDWTSASGTDETGLPYSAVVGLDANTGLPFNNFPLNGLVVKTYQSDLFNNWVKTEWIDGENGIAAITAISTSDGSFTIDTLNLSEKLYNMLNRVAVSDGSYEGWQDAVYTQSPRRHIESPVYLGGSSSEIVFEEIVQTSETTETSPLGNLAGKGRLMKRKGGHISVKIDEASFIIGIVSLTPRINYTQGNEWYLTDLFSMDDLHKPALDGIGFQNLIAEQLAWWDTKINSGGTIASRSVIGKVPAWINYMTAVDKGYGDFAELDGNGFMLLQRSYEVGENYTIKDATTYIDPQKYNYAFAYKGIDAQNFWVQIYEDIKARRLMSAKQIPNI